MEGKVCLKHGPIVDDVRHGEEVPQRRLGGDLVQGGIHTKVV